MDIEAGEAAPKLPTWIKASQDGQQLFGIPQQKDLGQHNVQLTKGRNRQLEVAEDRTTACGPDRSTIWLEIFDTRLMSQLSIEDQFKAAQTLLANLKDAGVRSDDIRLFPRSYLDRYRTVAETIHRLDQGSGGSKAQDQLVFVLNISCGELTEQASEVISAVAEDGLDFQVVQGTLEKSRLAQQQQLADGGPKPGEGQPKEGGASQPQPGSSSTALLVTFILIVILLALVAGLALYWLRNKQAQKRQKQANNEANGKGPARPGADANNTALSPDSSTTPMLAADPQQQQQQQGSSGAKKS